MISSSTSSQPASRVAWFRRVRSAPDMFAQWASHPSVHHLIPFALLVGQPWALGAPGQHLSNNSSAPGAYGDKQTNCWWSINRQWKRSPPRRPSRPSRPPCCCCLFSPLLWLCESFSSMPETLAVLRTPSKQPCCQPAIGHHEASIGAPANHAGQSALLRIRHFSSACLTGLGLGDRKLETRL